MTVNCETPADFGSVVDVSPPFDTIKLSFEGPSDDAADPGEGVHGASGATADFIGTLETPPNLERVVPAFFRCLSEDEEDDEGKEDDQDKGGEGSRQDEDAADKERRRVGIEYEDTVHKVRLFLKPQTE